MMTSVSYYWNDSIDKAKKFGSQKEIGFLAQDIQPLIPEAISVGRDGYLNFDITKVIPILVEAQKSSQEKIKSLESLVSDLIKRITELEKKVV
jgi:hypothetical protein